ncbi:hypothetical protein PINS_up007345 [Pythium insidiosum]|nr:hypothetical protein PINS_up007345 [Pythium insidiosum]
MIRDTQQTIITDPETGVEKAFTFDYSYNSFVPSDDPDFASQDTVWNDIGIKVSTMDCAGEAGIVVTLMVLP